MIMDNEKEISFGAFDSELMHQEIYIPEGFEATIEGNKIILTRIKSEDERITKEIIEYLKDEMDAFPRERDDYQRWIAWLEKQGKVVNEICKENDDSLTNEDEKIRKALIEYFNEQCDMSDWNGVYGYQVVAWLEKQANHANFRNKIQIGDKVTRNRDGVLVNLSQLNRVAKKDEKQSETYTKKDVDNAFVEGMALAKDELEKQGEQNHIEQNLEMVEALRTEYEKGRADAFAQMQKGWSEDDEKMLNSIIEDFGDGKTSNMLQEYWLKSLKERIGE